MINDQTTPLTHAQAEAGLRRALAMHPDRAEWHYHLANFLRESGRLDEAVASFRCALAIRPDYGEAQNNLGLTLRALGRAGDAEACFRRALRFMPGHVLILNNLGATLLDLGRPDEALLSLQQALASAPDDVEALNNLGMVFRALGRLDESAACVRRALLLQPDHAGAHNNLGITLFDQGRLDEAEVCFRHALAINPQDTGGLNNLGNTLLGLGRPDEAEACLRRALAIRPDFAEALNNLGNALRDLGQPSEAEARYRQALRIRPDYVEAHSNLGSVLVDFGKMDEAEVSLTRAIALAPDAAAPLATALLFIPYRPDDPRFSRLEAVYARRAELALEDRIRLNFAMGRVLEHLGQYDRSFAAYEEGNQLHFRLHPFDEAADERIVEQTRGLFTECLLQDFAAVAGAMPPQPDDRTPVFIVGMPRSGSTLIEQVLASHPAVFGAGELTLLGEVLRQARRVLAEVSDRNQALSALRALGRTYLDQVWRLAPQSTHICDKLPGNFYHLGLIHLMLPGARIIHSLRDPLDVCFSGYSVLFRSGHEYSYDLTALGRQYRRYCQLMRHWRAVLPPGRILDVRYEEHVAGPEREARRLLTHLGLPWDPVCLRFHESGRAVTTASVVQVRKPVYSTSVARWRRFEPYLETLCAAIGDADQP